MASMINYGTRFGENPESGWVNGRFTREGSTPEYPELKSGKVKGRFRATGIRPKFDARLKQCGIVLPTQMFQTGVEIN
jgi:hypothetical protein